MPAGFPKYPEVLTSENWERKKALLTPEIGLGKELKKARLAYDAIPQARCLSLKSVHSPTELGAATTEAAAVKPFLDAATGALQHLAEFAYEKAAEARKAKVFPSRSRDLIGQITDAAGNLAVAIRDTPNRWMQGAVKRASEWTGKTAK